MDGTTTKEDVRIDKDDADELNRDGNEKESVEAAATAFDFDRAEAETEELLIKTTGEADEA